MVTGVRRRVLRRNPCRDRCRVPRFGALLATVMLLLAGGGGLAGSLPSPAQAAVGPWLPATGLGPRVTIRSAQGPQGPVTAAVEMAVSSEGRTRGLMERESLPPDAGMLFVFPFEEEHAFWMERTLIPLDMIFIGADGRVAGIVSSAEPLTRTPRGTGLLSLAVLEVNGGWADRRGVRPGDFVRFEGGPAVPGLTGR